MTRQLTSSLVVRLIDQVTAPAKKVAQSLLGLNNAAKGGFGARLNTAIESNNRAIGRMRGELFGAVGTFYLLRDAITAPIRASANFETMLEDIGQKADIPVENLGALGQQIRQVARDTNQATSEIGKAVDFLVGMGAKTDLAITVAGPIGQAATAYRAATEDLGKSVFAVTDNLKVPAEQAAFALDIMAKAGKEGGFELRDMAQYFPEITASAQFLGIKGAKGVADLAAALEVARKGAADGAQAANNMANFFQKIVAPRTRKNFAEIGVDLDKELQYASDHGISVMEHMLNVIDKVTNHGDPAKLGALFQDKQVQEFIKPLLANMEEYRRIREEAMGSQGTVAEDYARRIKTALGVQMRFAASIENLNVAIGRTLLPVLTDLADKLIPVIDALGRFADAHPDITAAVVTSTAAIIGFKIALTGLKLVGLIGKGGVLSLLAIGFNTVGKAAIFATAAFRDTMAVQTALGSMLGDKRGGVSSLLVALRSMAVAVPGVAAIGEGLAAVATAAAAFSAPVWGAIAAAVGLVAAGGFLLWKYWDRVTSVVGGVSRRFGELLPKAIPLPAAIQPIVDLAQNAGTAFKWASDHLGTFIGWLGQFFQQEVGTDEQKAAWGDAGYEFADNMINSIKGAFAGFFEWCRTIPSQVIAAIGQIDLSNLFHWPSLPNWGGGPGATSNPSAVINGSSDPGLPAPSGHRAGGGSVWPGGSFLVGDGGEEEIFSPKTSGTITPVSKAGGPSIRQIGPFHITGNDPQEIARQVIKAIEDSVGEALRGAHADSEAWDY